MLFAALVVLLRFINVHISLGFDYELDLEMAFIFGFGVITIYNKTGRKSWINSLLIDGSLQILVSIILFESTRILIFQIGGSYDYLLSRIYMSIYILIVGSITNTLTLTIYSRFKQETKSTLDLRNDELLDQ